MIRVGFIGCGGIAREYLSRLDALKDVVRVTAFCDLDETRASDLAAGREARTYTDYRRMLHAEQLDAVFDNLPPFARENELVLAAEHGCAIFTTKPLGLDLETAHHSLQAIERARVINSVGYMFRYSGITDYAKSLVADRPVAMVLGHVLGAMPEGWNSSRALSGGQLVEQSTHIFDLARYFLGDVDSVYALGRAGHVADRVDYEDVTTVGLNFTGGGIGNVASTCVVWNFFWGFTILARDLHLELVFDEWTVRGSVDGRPVDYRDEIKITGYPEQIEAFVRAVQTRDQSLVRCTYRDGMGTLATTLAANKSLESGRPEAVER